MPHHSHLHPHLAPRNTQINTPTSPSLHMPCHRLSSSPWALIAFPDLSSILCRSNSAYASNAEIHPQTPPSFCPRQPRSGFSLVHRPSDSPPLTTKHTTQGFTARRLDAAWRGSFAPTTPCVLVKPKGRRCDAASALFLGVVIR